MSRIWLSLLPLITICAGVFASAAKSPTLTASRSSQALELAIKADRNLYRMSDILHLETRLTNVGKEDVYVREWDLCWNPARGLTMNIADSAGKDVKGRILLDCVPPPPREGDVYQFFKLPPRRFYGLDDEFNVSDLLNKPGEYSISATFSGFSSSDWTLKYLAKDPIAKLPLWTMEEAPLISQPIHITVKP